MGSASSQDGQQRGKVAGVLLEQIENTEVTQRSPNHTLGRTPVP